MRANPSACPAGTATHGAQPCLTRQQAPGMPAAPSLLWLYPSTDLMLCLLARLPWLPPCRAPPPRSARTTCTSCTCACRRARATPACSTECPPTSSGQCAPQARCACSTQANIQSCSCNAEVGYCCCAAMSPPAHWPFSCVDASAPHPQPLTVLCALPAGGPSSSPASSASGATSRARCACCCCCCCARAGHAWPASFVAPRLSNRLGSSLPASPAAHPPTHPTFAGAGRGPGPCGGPAGPPAAGRRHVAPPRVVRQAGCAVPPLAQLPGVSGEHTMQAAAPCCDSLPAMWRRVRMRACCPARPPRSAPGNPEASPAVLS